LPGIVLLIDHSDRSRIIFHALAAEFSIDTVVREGKPPRWAFFKRRLTKLGWHTVLGQVVFAACIIPLLRWEASRRRRELLQQHGMDESPIPDERVTDVRSANDDQTIALLQKKSPQIIVVNGTRILDEKLLNATSAVCLNTHVGITPLYRGVHGGYWALASGHPEHFGVTIHGVDKGIDTGDILAQALLTPADADNFSTYPLLQIAGAIPLLKQVIRDAISGELKTLPPPPGTSKLWSHPTAIQYLKYRIALGIR
jgi:folate-dependent phosphoribosylglycinamide formyltransferase PurN